MIRKFSEPIINEAKVELIEIDRKDLIKRIKSLKFMGPNSQEPGFKDAKKDIINIILSL